MSPLIKLNVSSLFKLLSGILLFLFISYSIAGQDTRKDKKTKKADALLKDAKLLSDSAKYDSAIVLLEKASLIYKEKNAEKYIQCENEIIKQ